MLQAVLYPSRLGGSVSPPPSKSFAHRAMICAALSKGVSRLSPIALSEDMRATIRSLQALGTGLQLEESRLTVDGIYTFCNILSDIDCRESGSTLRFMIPVAALSGERITFTGKGRLPERPLGPYLDCLPPKGVNCTLYGETSLPLTIEGRLRPGLYELPGNVSSQFITGLLLALPMLPGDSEIRLTSPLESAAYVKITTEVQAAFGVEIEETAAGYRIPGGCGYSPCDYQVESDWSQAAFWLAAGALSAPLRCEGLNPHSIQGDRAILELLERFGARTDFIVGSLHLHPTSLQGIEIDASQIPDLVPILAVVAALSEGHTVIYNAARLRLKESDRLHAIALALNSLGAQVSETTDGLEIDGVPGLHGGIVDSFNDHRIVMATAIASLRADGDVVINDAGCISKSYPDFFEQFRVLGGNVDVIDMG